MSFCSCRRPRNASFVICPLILFILWDIWRRHKLDKEEAARTALLEAELEALKAERSRADSEKK